MLVYSVESQYPLLTAISSMRPNDTNVESLTEISAILFYTVVLLDQNRAHTNLVPIATLNSVIKEE